jgi:hypothetical protein
MIKLFILLTIPVVFSDAYALSRLGSLTMKAAPCLVKTSPLLLHRVKPPFLSVASFFSTNHKIYDLEVVASRKSEIFLVVEDLHPELSNNVLKITSPWETMNSLLEKENLPTIFGLSCDLYSASVRLLKLTSCFKTEPAGLFSQDARDFLSDAQNAWDSEFEKFLLSSDKVSLTKEQEIALYNFQVLSFRLDQLLKGR